MVAQIDRAFIAARPWKLWSRLVAYGLFEGRPLTTRGRWMNPVVFAGHRLWSLMPLRRPVRDPILILGTGRSGTTILGTILGIHRDAGYLNEPKALWQAALGDDDLIGSYSNRDGRYRMGREDARAESVRRLHRSYRAFLGMSLSRRVVDKYPELIFRVPMLRSIFPEARLILLVRNGQDTCQSIAGWSRDHQGNSGREDWWGLDDRKWKLLVADVMQNCPVLEQARPVLAGLDADTDRAAVEWIATMQEALALGRTGDRDALILRYEDLVADPRGELDRLLQFCALQPDEVMLRYGEKVLRPAPRHEPPRLHPALVQPFADTMAALGYAA